jgi:microcystin synthetase protein McyG
LKNEVLLVARCAAQLAPILRGQCDPLSVVFGQDGGEMVEAVYRDSPWARFANALVRCAIVEATARAPSGRIVNVLEIGAGTGGTTAHVLPALASDRTRYVFTDVSPRFLASARQKFSDQQFIDFQVLDIEQSPARQGFAAGTFDIILG